MIIYTSYFFSFQIITLPISVPGAKPGDLPQQQTLQIQVVNPGTGAPGTGEKYAVPLFQQAGATVLTLAYSNPHQDQGDPSGGATAIQLQVSLIYLIFSINN